MEEARELGARGEWISGRNDDAEGEEREVEDGDVKEVRGEDQSGVVFGKREEGGEVGG